MLSKTYQEKTVLIRENLFTNVCTMSGQMTTEWNGQIIQYKNGIFEVIYYCSFSNEHLFQLKLILAKKVQYNKVKYLIAIF